MIRRIRGKSQKLMCIPAMCFVVAIVAPHLAVGASVLTNASQVRALTQQEAAQRLPVTLRGVVIDPRERTLFLADPTAAIYLLADQDLFVSYRRGDRLEVQGTTDPGEFAPIVRVNKARKVGAGELPTPQTVTYQQLITGSLDAQWIEIEGVVRGTIGPDPGSDIWRILLFADGGVVPVRGDFPKDPLIQVDAEVRVQAVCLYQFNQRRQVLTPVLAVPSGLTVHVEKPAPVNPFDAPVRSAESLLQFSPEVRFGHRVHVRGTVLHAQPGSYVWIRDASSGLRVQAQQQADLQPGDEIDVLGFPSYGSQSPMLEDAVFHKTGSTRRPTAIVLTNATAAFDHEDDLVQIDALLTEIQPVLEGLAFTFDLDETVFKGVLKLPGNPSSLDSWLPGSKVRVTGICSLIHDDVRPLMGVWQPQSFQILLRSTEDLSVLQRPTWWTPRHLIFVLGAVATGLLLAIGVLTLVSRHHLRAQARNRATAEAEFAAILAERNRVAREIHDTLAQGLAATSVQLRLARKTALNIDELNHHLDAAQQLVGESLEEARNSIWNRRSQILETSDLSGALDGILKQMAEGSELQTNVKVKGRARRLAPVIENNLLRAGQEAITNAIRHANARHIIVTLDFGEKAFRLTVRDDGRGFDPAKPEPNAGGFGLVGMRERAAELKGELKVQSAMGQGTEITMVVPLPGE